MQYLRLDGKDVYDITICIVLASSPHEGLKSCSLGHCMADVLQSFSLPFHRFGIGLIHRPLYVLDVRAIVGAIGIIRQEARCLGVLRAREDD